MRTNANRVKTLGRQMVTDIITHLGKNNIDEIKFQRPFVINLDVTSPSGDDWGTEAMVVTHMNNTGNVYADTSEVTGNEIKLADLSLDELAFILDEIEEGRVEELVNDLN